MTLLGPHSWDVVEPGLTPGSLVSVRTLNRYPILVFGVCTLGVGAGASAVDGAGFKARQGSLQETVKGMEAPGGQEEGGACLGCSSRSRPACRCEETRVLNGKRTADCISLQSQEFLNSSHELGGEETTQTLRGQRRPQKCPWADSPSPPSQTETGEWETGLSKVTWVGHSAWGPLASATAAAANVPRGARDRQGQ